MNAGLDNLQRAVEREMSLLDALPPVEPSAACVQRVQAAVLTLARAGDHRRNVLRLARYATGVAAAIALAVGLAAPASPTITPGTADADLVLGEWAAAWEDSSTRLVNLIDDGWITTGFGGATDDSAEVDDYLDGLDQLFSTFEAL